MIPFKKKTTNGAIKGTAVLLFLLCICENSVGLLQTRDVEPNRQSSIREGDSRKFGKENLLEVSPYIRDVRADSRQSRIDARDIRTDFREIRSELNNYDYSRRQNQRQLLNEQRRERGVNSRDVSRTILEEGSIYRHDASGNAPSRLASLEESSRRSRILDRIVPSNERLDSRSSTRSINLDSSSRSAHLSTPELERSNRRIGDASRTHTPALRVTRDASERSSQRTREQQDSFRTHSQLSRDDSRSTSDESRYYNRRIMDPNDSSRTRRQLSTQTATRIDSERASRATIGLNDSSRTRGQLPNQRTTRDNVERTERRTIIDESSRTRRFSDNADQRLEYLKDPSITRRDFIRATKDYSSRIREQLSERRDAREELERYHQRIVDSSRIRAQLAPHRARNENTYRRIIDREDSRNSAQLPARRERSNRRMVHLDNGAQLATRRDAFRTTGDNRLETDSSRTKARQDNIIENRDNLERQKIILDYSSRTRAQLTARRDAYRTSRDNSERSTERARDLADSRTPAQLATGRDPIRTTRDNSERFNQRTIEHRRIELEDSSRTRSELLARKITNREDSERSNRRIIESSRISRTRLSTDRDSIRTKKNSERFNQRTADRSDDWISSLRSSSTKSTQRTVAGTRIGALNTCQGRQQFDKNNNSVSRLSGVRDVLELASQSANIPPKANERSSILISAIQTVLVMALLGQILGSTPKSKLRSLHWQQLFSIKEKLY